MAAKAEARRSGAAAKRKRSKLAAVPAAAATADDAKFDRLIYERVRLGIMSALAVREELTFTELPHVHEIVRGSSPALGLSHHGARPQRAASLPRPRRGRDQGDAPAVKKFTA
jgi:hypothetical protein